MGRSTGLEPATLGSTILRSNQLSYDRHKAHYDEQSLVFRQRETIKKSIDFFAVS